jgi:endonuclease/exonuclease/phosphatase family metal-dependent hydrolase
MLADADRELVKKLMSTHFHGYAEVRMAKLKPEVLDELVRVLAMEDARRLTTTEQKVAFLLEVKKQVKKEDALRHKGEAELRCETPVPSEPAASPPPKMSVAPPTPDGKISRPRAVFKTAHEIHVVAFNCLKLRLDHAELKEEWDAAILEFARYDVLLLSEVRASDKFYETRTARLLQMLNEATDSKWEMRSSVPSGPGAKEVHLVLAKKPISILNVTTLETLDGVKMDHSPLVALLEDTRFVGELRRFNMVSVHFPPNSSKARRADRDVQIRKFLSTYPLEAAARLNSPFTNQAAKEQRKTAPYVAHIVGGDFNADAKELRELEADKHGWDVALGSVRTSVGGKSYDNFCINREAKDHLTIGTDVLDLSRYANFSAGQQGLSDHAPIALRLTEVPRLPPRRSADRSPPRSPPRPPPPPLP